MQWVGFEDAERRRQRIGTTDEHPYHSVLRRWTASQELEIGEAVSGPAEVTSAVMSNVRQPRPGGATVYNMEIEGTHTYFVRAQGSEAEPVWVHNAAYLDGEVPVGSSGNQSGHDMRARLYRGGELTETRQFERGNLSEVEKALGAKMGIGWRIGDTEARAVRQMDLKEGDLLELFGHYEPCESCRTIMAAKASETGAQINYRFVNDAGKLRIWSANQRAYIYAEG